MPIFVHRASRVICQGMVNEQEFFWVHQCMLYGTQVVAWVRSGSGGEEKLKIPVFDSVREARRQTSATVSLISVSPPLAADAIIEAIEGGIELIICLTSDIPAKDMVDVHQVLKRHPNSRLIGPGSCGLVTPLQSKVGLMPAFAFSPGEVGMVSCADTLGYETAWKLTASGIGQSTFVSLGSDPFAGTSIVDVLREFELDIQTESILLVLQSGLYGIEAVAEWVHQNTHKPIFAIVAGQSLPTPPYCPSIVEPPSDGTSIVQMLSSSGVSIIDNPSLIGAKKNS